MMASNPTPASALDAISRLLGETSAMPVLSRNAGSASTIYDIQYRVFVNSIAFNLHAQTSPAGARIQRARLKLLQFVAIRPWLLPALIRWSTEEAARQQSLDQSQSLRRAFLADIVHDATVDFLIAVQALSPLGQYLTMGENHTLMQSADTISTQRGLFTAEREILTAVQRVRITRRMLEGW